MAQKNFMSARALTMEELENVNGGFFNGLPGYGVPRRILRKILKKDKK